MADKAQAFDVWIQEGNTVYRGVPFTVVSDWLQQGRLLAEDQVRPTGKGDFQPLSQVSALAAYLPRAEPFRADDQAEALEPVEVDIGWKPRAEDEEEDVDMIPLIDISLVLLIFFMMTTTVVVASTQIRVPQTTYFNVDADAEMLWIGIDRAPNEEPQYSLGLGQKPAAEEDRKLSEAEVLERLEAKLKELGPRRVRIVAHQNLDYEVVKRMTVALERVRAQGVAEIFAEVSERKP